MTFKSRASCTSGFIKSLFHTKISVYAGFQQAPKHRTRYGGKSSVPNPVSGFHHSQSELEPMNILDYHGAISHSNECLLFPFPFMTKPSRSWLLVGFHLVYKGYKSVSIALRMLFFSYVHLFLSGFILCA